MNNAFKCIVFLLLLLISSVVFGQVNGSWSFYPVPTTGVTQATYDAALGTKNSPMIEWSKVDQSGNTRQFMSNSPETISNETQKGKLWIDYGQGADIVNYHGYLSHINLIKFYSGKSMKKVIGLMLENLSDKTDYTVTLKIAGSSNRWSEDGFMAGVYADMTNNWTTTTLTVKHGEICALRYWVIAEYDIAVFNFRMTVSDNGAAGPVRCRLATVLGDEKPSLTQQEAELTSIMQNANPPLNTSNHPRGTWTTSNVILSNENNPIDIDKMGVDDVVWLWLTKSVYTGTVKTGCNNDVPYLSSNSYGSQSDIIGSSNTNRAITNKGMYGVYTHIDLVVKNNDTTNPITQKKFGIYLRQPGKYLDSVGARDYNGVLSVNSSAMGRIWLDNIPENRECASQCLISDSTGTEGMHVNANSRIVIPIDIMHVGPAMMPIVFVVKRLD